MDEMVGSAQLVKAAEEFLAAAKIFNGEPDARAALVKQADNLRYYAEDGFGTIFRQWDHVRIIPCRFA
jgi:hypothetical protein